MVDIRPLGFAALASGLGRNGRWSMRGGSRRHNLFGRAAEPGSCSIVSGEHAMLHLVYSHSCEELQKTPVVPWMRSY